jgi:hypothetical protein
VEFANTLQAGGLDKLAALREASLTRLRPVLMTSAATVFGHLPLVLVTGPGAEARNSIGTVLVAGMTVGTIFTLFVVPVFYSLIAAEHKPATVSEDSSQELPAFGRRAAGVGLVARRGVRGFGAAPPVLPPRGEEAAQRPGELVGQCGSRCGAQDARRLKVALDEGAAVRAVADVGGRGIPFGRGKRAVEVVHQHLDAVHARVARRHGFTPTSWLR